MDEKVDFPFVCDTAFPSHVAVKLLALPSHVAVKLLLALPSHVAVKLLVLMDDFPFFYDTHRFPFYDTA